MLFLLGYGRRYFEGFVDQFPEERRDDIRDVGAGRVCAGGCTCSSALGQSILYGLLVGWLCWALDLPAAISLGFAVAVFTPTPADRCARRRGPGAAPGVRLGGVVEGCRASSSPC